MSYGQGKLFPEAEKMKLRNARVSRLTRSYWDRLWKKDYDPGYIVQVELDDIPSLARVTRKSTLNCVILKGPDGVEHKSDEAFYRELKAVVLSKGLEDQNRRIVAEDDGGWITGLYLSLLQRQVRDGTEAVKGTCYATLTRLECDEGWQHVVDRWTQDLLLKRRF